MLTGKKFVLVAVASFVLLFWTTAIAAQIPTETSVDARVLNNKAVDCVEDHIYAKLSNYSRKPYA